MRMFIIFGEIIKIISSLFKNIYSVITRGIQGVFEVEAFLLTCDSCDSNNCFSHIFTNNSLRVRN
jgi:hypothetical protein